MDQVPGPHMPAVSPAQLAILLVNNDDLFLNHALLVILSFRSPTSLTCSREKYISAPTRPNITIFFYHVSVIRTGMNTKFDPFNDRLARDIRNDLSGALIKSLPELTQVKEVSSAFLGDKRLLPHHQAYIHERLRRYQAVQETIKKYQVSGIVCPALAMWDERLFFEVHECLEGEWYPAPAGDRKKALQALICAAGTFVHVEQGNKAGTAKMAERARSGLKAFGHALPELGAALEAILACLEQANTPPRIFALTHCSKNS